MAIDKQLEDFPVPDFVQKQWETDLRINLRGVAADMSMVHGALEIDAAERERLEQEAIRLTGLDNPNSVAQLREWLGGRPLRLAEDYDPDADTDTYICVETLNKAMVSYSHRRVCQDHATGRS